VSTGLELLRGQVESALASGTALRIRGGGSKDFYGNASAAELLDTRAWRGIESYEPSELVLTARCGTSLADVEQVLAEQGQMLAFEPPHFSPGATLGGCVAAGLAGPRRASAGFTHGGIRDFLLGARLLDGRGRLLRFGGTVMKNVAGFDVSRVLAGSLGVLGLIVEVSLKVVPRPACERSLRMEMKETEALDRLNEWAGRPLPVSASHWRDGELTLRLSGSEPAVRQAASRLGGQVMDADSSSAFWNALRDHQDAWFAGDTPLWRLSLPSTAPPLDSGEPQCIEWGGAQRWLRSNRAASQIRQQAAALGGHATLFRRGAGDAGAISNDGSAFAPLTAPLLAIHKRLKDEFDPRRLFNPDRLLPGL